MARRAAPEYGRRAINPAELSQLLEFAHVDLYIVRMEDVAYVTPPIRGRHDLYVSDALKGSERDFWILHEIAHFLAGDSAEPIRQGDYDPYPPWERVADLFAALGVLPLKDRNGDAQWIEVRLRQLVPTEHIAWTRYRAPAIAASLSQGDDLDAGKHDYW